MAFVAHGADSDDVDFLRARLYGLLGTLLSRPPRAEFLTSLAGIAGDHSPLGRCLGDLAAVAGSTGADEVLIEYEALFVGVVRGEVVPYASYYRTGFLFDRPLARLRQDLGALGVERGDGVPEPEDHLGLLCETMAGLIAGPFAAPLPEQRRFFQRHLQPWAGRCFGDIERAAAARLYRPVGAIGRLFVEIEADGFALVQEAPRMARESTGGLA